MIFRNVSRGQRQTYNCHSSFQQNIWPYSWLSRIQFFPKSGSSALTLAGALICFITPPFPYTKSSVRISPICGCNSNWNVLFKIIRKRDKGEETPLLDFVTWMKLKLLCPNFAWKLAHQWVMNWLSKERKDTSCHIMSKKTIVLKKIYFWYFKVQVSKKT